MIWCVTNALDSGGGGCAEREQLVSFHCLDGSSLAGRAFAALLFQGMGGWLARFVCFGCVTAGFSSQLAFVLIGLLDGGAVIRIV